VLNVDDAVQGNPGRASAGGVIRGEDGEWVIGFSENLGHCYVVKAELRAFLRGLRIAREISISKLWIQSDSITVLGMLNNPPNWNSEFGPLIHQCRQLIEWKGWDVKLSHCFREVNQVADKLAKLGLDLSLGVLIHRDPPVETRGSLYADKAGVFWPRVIKNK